MSVNPQEQNKTLHKALAELNERIQTCQSCPLGAGRKRVVLGEGDLPSHILFLGEGPGEEEDESGRPFVGRSGRLLRETIKRELYQRRAKYFITNVVRCRPPENRDPTPGEVEACWPWTREILRLSRPSVIVTLGRISLAYLAKKSGVPKAVGASKITDLVGKVIAVPERHFYIFPCFHPAYVLRNRGELLEQYQNHFKFLAMSLPTWTASPLGVNKT